MLTRSSTRSGYSRGVLKGYSGYSRGTQTAFTGVSADAFFDAVRRLIDEFYLDQSVVHALSSLQVGRSV